MCALSNTHPKVWVAMSQNIGWVDQFVDGDVTVPFLEKWYFNEDGEREVGRFTNEVSGFDGLPYLPAFSGSMGHNVLHTNLKHLWVTAKYPDGWALGLVVQTPKAGSEMVAILFPSDMSLARFNVVSSAAKQEMKFFTTES